MVRYVFNLKVKDSQNTCSYALDITANQENNPERIFTLEAREILRSDLQRQSLCKIDDNHLSRIIKTWVQDIKEGYRNSSINLDLPLLIASNLANLQEAGYQELPSLLPPNLLDIEPCLGMLPPLNFI